MTTAPRQPRRHVAYFLDTLAWAGVTLRDEGGRLVCENDATGILQPEVDKREREIRAWWEFCEYGECSEQQEVRE
jgi:hypothetical protein